MSKYVWQVKNKKQEQVQGADPVKVMTDFGKKYGTRGNISLVRWAETSDDMLTTTGLFFKGTFKEVVSKLKEWATAHPNEVTSAAKKSPVFKANWTPMETKVLRVLRGVDADTGIELEELRKQLAGKALVDLGKVPASVDKAIESLIRGYFAMKAKRGGVWYIVPVHVKGVQATAAGEGVDFVGNAVIGDLKRIRSLIDTWSKKTGKGAMDKESLAKYVEYQKDVAAYIVRKYMPKLSASYQAKVKAI